jgi:hypothetical protein
MEFNGGSELEILAYVRSSHRLGLVWELEDNQLLDLGKITPAGSGTWEHVGSELRFLPGSVNGSGYILSFTVEFPILDREIHSFPLPTCDIPLYGCSVLLPQGWTSDSPNVEKRLDPGSGRIALIWRNAGDGATARLLRPGSRSRIFLATLIAWFPYVLVLAATMGIIGLTLRRSGIHRAGSGTTKEL